MPRKKLGTITAFRTWLSQVGADVLAPTNEWEMIRWQANGVTSVIYQNKKGDRTYVGEAEVIADD